mgnify:FL=1
MKFFFEMNDVIFLGLTRHAAFEKKNSVMEGLIDPEKDIYAIPSQVKIRLVRLVWPLMWSPAPEVIIHELKLRI